VPNLHLTYLENEGHILSRQTAAISEFLSAVASVPSRAARGAIARA
jgi:hypothetical protein